MPIALWADYFKQIMVVSFLRFLFNLMSLRYPTWLKAFSCGYIVWFAFNLWFVCSLIISEQTFLRMDLKIYNNLLLHHNGYNINALTLEKSPV